MTPIELAYAEFEVLGRELIDKHDELGMRSSSQFAESVEVRKNSDNSVSLYAAHYIEQLASGREPGRFPPISNIEQWIEDKPIAFIESEISISSLAFLIARKIAQEGTDYYIQGGTDLIESVITPARIQQIIDKIGFTFLREFETFVFNRLQELAA